MFSKSILSAVLAVLASTSGVGAQLDGFTLADCAYLQTTGSSDEINAKENACFDYQSTAGDTCEDVLSSGNTPRWNVLPINTPEDEGNQVQSNECLAYWLCDRDTQDCSTCGDCSAVQNSTVAPDPIPTTLGATQDNTTDVGEDGGEDGGDDGGDDVNDTSGAPMFSSSMVVVVGAGIVAMIL